VIINPTLPISTVSYRKAVVLEGERGAVVTQGRIMSLGLQM
jgi:hypothetical protein